MSKFKNSFLITLIAILLVFTQTLYPITTLSFIKEVKKSDYPVLLQANKEIELMEGITIKEGSLFYGIEADQVVYVQFADSYTTISIDFVQAVSEIEDENPEFQDPDKQYIIQILPKKTKIYSLIPENDEGIETNKEIEYPISKNEFGIDVLYFGNIEYYLSEEDRNKVLELREDNKTQPSEENHGDTSSSDEKIESESLKDGKANETSKERNAQEVRFHKPFHAAPQSIDEKDTNYQGEKESEQTIDYSATWKNSSTKYFEVMEDNLDVYDNRTGKLVKIGELQKGQVYPRVSDYGNWHRIQFGNIYGYVHKSGTKPSTSEKIKNLNRNYKHQSRTFKPINRVTVYDNTSGKLVPFGTIEKGTAFPIATDYGNWWRIIYADRVGYVSKKEVEVQFTKSDKYFKAETNLPIYDNRSGKLVKVGEVQKGEVYPRVSDYGNWHRIQFGNIYGYVSKSGTTLATGKEIKNLNTNFKPLSRTFTALETVTVYDNSSGKLVPFGTIDKGVSFPLTSDYGEKWWRIIYADRVGYISKDQVQVAVSKTDKYFRAIQNTEVYDNSTGKLKKVGMIYKGQAYPIVSDYGNWWRVQFGNGYGYVRKSHTGYATAREIKNLNTGYQNTNRQFKTKQKVRIYDNSTGKLIPFGELEEGQFYPIASNYGNWWRIIYLGRVGYVHKSEVQYDRIFVEYNISLKEAAKKQMKVNPQTDQYNGDIYIHRSHFSNINVNTNKGTVEKNALARTGASTNHHILYKFTDKDVENNNNQVEFIKNQNLRTSNWLLVTRKSLPTWINAPQSQVEYYMNPENFKDDPIQVFQFLDLRHYTGVVLSELKDLLEGAGILQDKAEVFQEAAKNAKINEIYLISHALLETGKGASPLSTGKIKVGKSSNIYVVEINDNKKERKLYTVENYNKNNPDNAKIKEVKEEDVKNVKRVPIYNVFGIGAVDKNSEVLGAVRAYVEGWTTIDKAINGGANFAGEKYIHAGQNTLYKMRWNPEKLVNGDPTHQYATDVGWAYKQVRDTYGKIYSKGNYNLMFEIPVYK